MAFQLVVKLVVKSMATCLDEERLNLDQRTTGSSPVVASLFLDSVKAEMEMVLPALTIGKGSKQYWNSSLPGRLFSRVEQ